MLWRTTIAADDIALESISVDGWGSWLSMGPSACSASVLLLGDWVTRCVSFFFPKLFFWALCGEMNTRLPLLRVLDRADFSQNWHEIASKGDDSSRKIYIRLAYGDRLVGHYLGVPYVVMRMGESSRYC